MSNKTVAIVVAVVVLAGAVWFMQGGSVPWAAENLPEGATPAATSGQQPAGGSTPAAPGGGAQGVQTFTSQGFGFTLQYPASVSIETTGVPAGGFTAQGAVGVVALYSRMGTVVDRLTISASSEPADVGACTNAPGVKSTATIGGVLFTRYQTSESVEGQDLTTTVHRVLRDRTCYELREATTLTEISRLTAPEIEQQRANSAASAALMSSIVQSLRFTY